MPDWTQRSLLLLLALGLAACEEPVERRDTGPSGDANAGVRDAGVVGVDDGGPAPTDAGGPLDGAASSMDADVADAMPADGGRPDVEPVPEDPWIPAPCDFGQCCRDGFVLPVGQRCQARRGREMPTELDVEYRCSVAGDGLERRYGYPGCDGEHALCHFDLPDIVWADWERVADCPCIDGYTSRGGEFYPGPKCDDRWRDPPESADGCVWSNPDGSSGPAPSGSACFSAPPGSVPFEGDQYFLFCDEDAPLGNLTTYAPSGRQGYCTGTEAGCTVHPFAGRQGDPELQQRACGLGQECVETLDGPRCMSSDRACSDPTQPCCHSEHRLRVPAGEAGDCPPVEFRCEGASLQTRQTRAICDGVTTACDFSRATPWVELVRCELPEICDADAARTAFESGSLSPSRGDPAVAGCVLQENGCRRFTRDGYPISNAQCCDPDTLTWLPYGTTCRVDEYVPVMGSPDTAPENLYYDCQESTSDPGDFVTHHDAIYVCGSTNGCVTYGAGTPIVEHCPPGEACREGTPRSGAGCLGADEACADPSNPCCASDGFRERRGTVCSTTPVETRWTCYEGVPTLQKRFPTCTGDGQTCSSEALTPWRVEGSTMTPCSGREQCVYLGDGTVDCRVPGAVECSSGACCDGGWTLPAGRVCDPTYPVREYRCSADGTEIEGRGAQRGCAGVDPSCPESSEHWVWTDWTTNELCGAEEMCVYDGVGDPYCYDPPPPCDSGACCSGGYVKSNSESCGIRYRTQRQCQGDYVMYRHLDYRCDGTSSECPLNGWRTVAGEWETSYYCPACDWDGSEFTCVEVSMSGDAPCGTSCGSAAECASGICSGGVCCGAGSSGGGTSSGTCFGNGTVIPRTGLNVGGVSVDEFRVRPRVGEWAGAAVLIDYYYEASTPGQRIPGTTHVWPAVRGPAGGTWYFTQTVVTPPDRTWTDNLGGGRSWGSMFCGGPGAESNCLPADTAQALYEAGLCYTGFLVTAN